MDPESINFIKKFLLAIILFIFLAGFMCGVQFTKNHREVRYYYCLITTYFYKST
jgi:hypothetical protein